MPISGYPDDQARRRARFRWSSTAAARARAFFPSTPHETPTPHPLGVPWRSPARPSTAALRRGCAVSRPDPAAHNARPITCCTRWGNFTSTLPGKLRSALTTVAGEVFARPEQDHAKASKLPAQRFSRIEVVRHSRRCGAESFCLLVRVPVYSFQLAPIVYGVWPTRGGA